MSNFRRNATLLTRSDVDFLNFMPNAIEMGLTNYIHSSISGFNADYKTLSHDQHLMAAAQRAKESVKSENMDVIKKLKIAAQEYKVKALGGTKTTPINNCPVIREIYDQTIVKQMRTIQQLLSWDFDNLPLKYKSLAQEKLIYDTTKTSQSRSQMYSHLGSAIAETITELLNNPTIKQFDSLKHNLELLQNNLSDTPADGHVFKYNNKHAADHNAIATGNFLSQLGLNWEEVSAQLLMQSIADNSSTIRQTVINVLKGGKLKLSDLQDETITVKIPNYGGKFFVGFSNKFRKNNNLTVGGTISFKQPVTDEWLSRFNDDIAIQQFTYIYRNYAALMLFNTDFYRRAGVKSISRYSKDAMVGPRKNILNQPMKSRRDKLIHYQAFYPILSAFTRYINQYLLRTVFFANSNDAGVKLFAQDFLQQVMSQDTLTLPAFLLTRDKAYEMWQVASQLVNMVDYKPVWNVEELFGDAGALRGRGRRSFSEPELRENYAVKRELILQEKRKGTKNVSFYQDIIAPNKDKLPVQLLTLTDLLPQSRNLRKKIALTTYLP